MVYKSYYNSPIGSILLVSDGENLIGLWLEGQKYYLGNIKEEIVLADELLIFAKTKDWLDKYFRKEKPSIKQLSLLPRGSAFRQEVWQILCDVPYGTVITYGDIAKKVAQKHNQKSMSAQAVGGAVGHNPISIIIPCHRVVGRNNSLTGYAGGIDKKIKLLELESIDVNNFNIPTKGSAI